MAQKNGSRVMVVAWGNAVHPGRKAMDKHLDKLQADRINAAISDVVMHSSHLIEGDSSSRIGEK